MPTPCKIKLPFSFFQRHFLWKNGKQIIQIYFLLTYFSILVWKAAGAVQQASAGARAVQQAAAGGQSIRAAALSRSRMANC